MAAGTGARALRISARIIAAAVIVIIIWKGPGFLETARVGTAFVAKQTCSCLFVAQRSAAACQHDFDARAQAMSVKVRDHAVKVSVLGVFSATAVFEEGFGCHVVD